MENLIIVSVYYNQKEFIKYQIASFKKFLKDDFTFFLFDNSTNGIEVDESDNLGYENFIYHRIPQNVNQGGDASDRAGFSLDYAIKKVIGEFPDNKRILIVDSDIFPIKDFSFDYFMSDCDFSGMQQTRGNVEYYTNQLLGIKTDKITDWKNFSFKPGMVENLMTDCGGRLFYFLKDNSNLSLKKCDLLPSMTLERNGVKEIWEKVYAISNDLGDFFNVDADIHGGKSFSEIFDNTFLHFRAGSNWIGFDLEIKKLREKNLFSLIEKITK